MTISKTGNPIAPSTNGRPAPVRVKLQRINAGFAKAHPPNGQGKVWWARLHKALGTSSSAFVNASLLQLQQAACLRGGSISEIGVNSALALIKAAEPRDEIEPDGRARRISLPMLEPATRNTLLRSRMAETEPPHISIH